MSGLAVVALIPVVVLGLVALSECAVRHDSRGRTAVRPAHPGPAVDDLFTLAAAIGGVDLRCAHVEKRRTTTWACAARPHPEAPDHHYFTRRPEDTTA